MFATLEAVQHAYKTELAGIFRAQNFQCLLQRCPATGKKKERGFVPKSSPILAFKGCPGHLLDAMIEYTDVLICGGGPVGLLTGLALVRMGISTVVIGEL